MNTALKTIIGLIVLAVAYYLISPLFITVEVNEELPEGLVVTNNLAVDVPSGVEKLTKEEREEMEKQEAEFLDVEVEVVEPMPEEMPKEVTLPTAHTIMHTAGHPAEG